MHQLQLSVSMLKDHWKRFDALAVGESIGMISISQTPPVECSRNHFRNIPVTCLTPLQPRGGAVLLIPPARAAQPAKESPLQGAWYFDDVGPLYLRPRRK